MNARLDRRAAESAPSRARAPTARARDAQRRARSHPDDKWCDRASMVAQPGLRTARAVTAGPGRGEGAGGGEGCHARRQPALSGGCPSSSPRHFRHLWNVPLFSLSLSLSLSLSSVCFCFLFFFFTVPRVPNAPRLAARFTGAPVIPNFVLHPAFGPNVSTSSTSPPLRPNFIGLRRPA